MQSALNIPIDTTSAVYSAVQLLRRFLAHRYDFVLILILISGIGYPANAQDNVAQNNVAQNNVAQNNVAQNNVAQNNVAQNNVYEFN